MYKLPKSGRLRRNKSFQAVYRSGKSFANRQMVLYILPQRGSERRVGFAAGKRLGNAVVRNRVKRLLREAYRLKQHQIKHGFDLIIVGRQALVKETLPTVTAALLHLCERAKILV
ncbi:ribonuclease P protein component [Anaeroselena agilis]|uniref:Ribonuclease P protein component n=1 Tax=Anaeroselena agilis TaxID=3063788 RepID=A0ABU3P2V2_9FIRM|nr:ribonuclease P protein component [Selenomonadales bacterium 4137-cl]